ncbi:hypothetical protein IY145_12350 [Methylosinus sp. H3A]|uniref:hypothetical protein n=1 Tax=Methylosinus sp. H3A TaxID=2785786 RepID=UPI0018C25AFA|nr:hypothetical protein [Methylosinus sp. H3A]MBG0810169.1 hypothetical protein [Methylosinus sp. H3A]
MRLFLLALVLALLAAGANRLLRKTDEAEPAIVAASLGDARFAYAPAFARDESTRYGGALDRLSFLAVLPDFAPPPRPSADPRRRASEELDPMRVFVTLAPRDEALDPAERPSRLYARFLESEVWAGPGGLVMRRFEPGSPYELEQLYLAPPDGTEFFARCPRRDAGFLGSAPCIWALRWKTLDVEARFSAALLRDWEELARGLRAFLASIDGDRPR